MLHLTELAR